MTTFCLTAHSLICQNCIQPIVAWCLPPIFICSTVAFRTILWETKQVLHLPSLIAKTRSKSHDNINGLCRFTSTSTEIRKTEDRQRQQNRQNYGYHHHWPQLQHDLNPHSNWSLWTLWTNPPNLSLWHPTQPTNPFTCSPIKPNATSMYYKITHFPSPKGNLELANHNWKLTQTQWFYGHSYSAPTPTINILQQQFGLIVTKAFAIHIRYARHRFLNQSVLTSESNTTIPLLNGQLIGT